MDNNDYVTTTLTKTEINQLIIAIEYIDVPENDNIYIRLKSLQRAFQGEYDE